MADNLIASYMEAGKMCMATAEAHCTQEAMKEKKGMRIQKPKLLSLLPIQLCDLGQVISPLWTSCYPSVKWGFGLSNVQGHFLWLQDSHGQDYEAFFYVIRYAYLSFIFFPLSNFGCL